MNKQQRRIVINFAIVVLITLVATYGMVEFSKWTNYSESKRAMEQLSQMVSDYKKKNGSIHKRCETYKRKSSFLFVS